MKSSRETYIFPENVTLNTCHRTTIAIEIQNSSYTTLFSAGRKHRQTDRQFDSSGGEQTCCVHSVCTRSLLDIVYCGVTVSLEYLQN